MSTLKQFREWSVAQGQVSNPTSNSANHYPGQCVSLVQQYLSRVFGIGYAARGNAKDFVPPTFKKVTGAVKPGDIIRYGANYGYGYGHIGLIDDEGKFLDQNGIVVLRVGRRATPFGAVESIWRPTKKFVVKPAAPKPPITQSVRRKAKGTATVTASALNVRNSPDTKAKVEAVYKKGQVFTYDSYIIKNGYVWLSYVSFSGKRRYIAEGVYDGKKNSNLYVSGGVG